MQGRKLFAEIGKNFGQTTIWVSHVYYFYPDFHKILPKAALKQEGPTKFTEGLLFCRVPQMFLALLILKRLYSILDIPIPCFDTPFLSLFKNSDMSAYHHFSCDNSRLLLAVPFILALRQWITIALPLHLYHLILKVKGKYIVFNDSSFDKKTDQQIN